MTAKIDLTAMTLTEIENLGAVALRKFAAELGVKGASRGKKADLLDAIVPMWEAAREAAKPAKPAKAPKVRKIRFTQDEMAGEENSHSDQGHDAIAETPVGEYPTKWTVPAKKDLAKELAYVAEIREAMKACPICHPEIVANSAHSGSSRAGMVINVPLRADGRTKAVKVSEKLVATNDVKIRRFKGAEILTATLPGGELKLVWDAQGRYQYGESTFNGRKVRNVAEALRLAVTA